MRSASCPSGGASGDLQSYSEAAGGEVRSSEAYSLLSSQFLTQISSKTTIRVCIVLSLLLCPYSVANMMKPTST